MAAGASRGGYAANDRPPPSRPAPAARGDLNLFVGGFPESTLVEEIREIAEQYGRVTEFRVIRPKRPGGLTCAMLTYDSKASCEDAITYINGFAYGSNVLTCRWRSADGGAAEPPRGPALAAAPPRSAAPVSMPPRSAAGGGARGRDSSDSHFPSRGGGTKIFVGKIGAHIDGEAVKSCFSRFGRITDVIEPRAKGAIKVMFLNYDNEDSARRAVDVMNEQPLFPGEVPLRVKFE